MLPAGPARVCVDRLGGEDEEVVRVDVGDVVRGRGEEGQGRSRRRMRFDERRGCGSGGTGVLGRDAVEIEVGESRVTPDLSGS